MVKVGLRFFNATQYRAFRAKGYFAVFVLRHKNDGILAVSAWGNDEMHPIFTRYGEIVQKYNKKFRCNAFCFLLYCNGYSYDFSEIMEMFIPIN